MKLKTKYFILVSLMLSSLGVCFYFLLIEQKIFFILSELFLIFLLLFSIHVYNVFMNPLKLMHQGIDAITDQDFSVNFALTGSKEMDQLIRVYNSMIHKIRTERISLKEQHFFLEKLIKASPNGIIILDFDDHISLLNPIGKQLLELTETDGKTTLQDIEHPIAKAISKLKPTQHTTVKINGFLQYKCSLAQFTHQGFKRKFAIIENLSSELLQNEKAAYEKIIRMMAHEINNSIGAINSILHTVSDIQQESEHEQKEDALEALNIAVNRNNQLNEFMKNFASVVKLHKPALELVNLCDLTLKMTTLFKAQLAEKNIAITHTTPKTPVLIKADSSQLEQVYINIIKNAMESIGENGLIRVIVDEQAELYIIDNGKGIPEEIKQKLFQPFFSSKPQGQGIGLTLIKEILHRHQASFSLSTCEQNKTTFKIKFSV